MSEPQHGHPRKALGPVFISHASVDKPFVRELDRRLRREGFETWLDEKDMLVGDSIPREVSKALSTALAVVVVISDASARSSWVSYELTQAAHRMIEGRCRLVPVLIADTAPPPELTGLIYADCRPGKRGGTRRLLEALDSEARRANNRLATLTSSDALARSRGIDRILDSLFDSRGFASMEVSATRSIDWEFAAINVSGNDVDVVVDQAMDYAARGEELSIADWEDWRRRIVDDISGSFGLLVSEKPPSSALAERLEAVADDVHLERLPAGIFRGSGVLVLVCLSGRPPDDVGSERIALAREVLVEAAVRQEPPALPLDRP